MTNKLTTRHHRALASLLAGDDIKEAATAAGVGKRTIYRWLDWPTFHDELQRQKSKAIDQASVRLAGSMSASVGVMQSIRDDESAAASIRLRAANYLLGHALRYIEMNDILERLEQLEGRLQ